MCVAVIHGYAYMPMREVRLEGENVKENADTVRTQRGQWESGELVREVRMREIGTWERTGDAGGNAGVIH